MVDSKFKTILVILFALILLGVFMQDTKAVYLSSGGSCGPYTCKCKNIFGAVACQATCPSNNCGARCKCGPFEAKCEVLWCGPYHTCINDVHYFNPKCVSISWSAGISCRYSEVEPCTDHWTDSYRCSGSYLQRLYVERICGRSTCINIETWKNYQYCGSDYCSEWSSNYCKDDDVYHKRTCHDRGCANKACYDNIYTQEEKVEECGSSSWTDEYRCLGNWRQRKWINRGCSAGSCYETSEWKNYQDCSLTCFPGVLNEGCKGGTYTCKDGMCGFPLQSCSPPQYTDSGVACECNIEKGTVIRVCSGSGSCVSAEEKCDVDCGADLACQGLKPGDEYPGDPSKVCCKGEGVKIRLPKWYEAAP
ncbi:MAG: hypothetical protein AUK07_00970 [Parcubacteria group bacterium CG2_30_36_21]|uniref:Uncharacterized protein n=3 Tax=Candidatus Gribaldobacteria TaxID=2798536 RepID=A0A2M7VKX3_9BACT|nr:MAG: hypothetical protein AUK07_00970 [Parcubacteria group bacterium CG2_30_36_21]PIR90891.1 MAG: hypothetical protein COU02_01745 [bacterium (Candidatus Gribaldobacteria) CG10_big_fil_rev_8_21_14_0_10_37_46]PIV14004.1 MAG: hypothetical protein COS44_01330 [bacterium (Candidatus Gribaldobacteria) CG03_land_8_20_14_0_80_36_40]PJA02319.1 MAG: hypothetical protein COX73_01410 [bacterium (Candidatus Gribaldobacteria) CG_4_10_14_0_2_um_filter_36_18]